MRKLLLVVATVVGCLVLVRGAFAGGGTINVAPNNPIMGFDKGDLAINIQFNSFPTEFQLQSAMDKVQVARKLLCDASEGQVRLRRVTFSASNYSKTEADIWVLPANERAYSGGRVAGGPGQIVLFGNDCPYPLCSDDWDVQFPPATPADGHGQIRGIWDGFVLAHELSHYVLLVGDSYDEQRRFLSGCGVGPSFDADGAPPFALDTAVNNTIMQGPGYLCLDDAGRNHVEVDPEHWDYQPCRDDADCNIFVFGGAGGNGFRHCGIPQTELSWRDNHDQRFGDFGAAICPAAEPAHYIQLRVDLNPNASGIPATCGDMSVAAHEECEVGSFLDCALVDPAFRAGTDAACGPDCRWDASGCQVGTCGNGALDAGEECDSSSPLAPGTMGSVSVGCSTLGGSPLDLNSASCGFDTCVYSRTACQGPRGLFTCGNNTLDAGEECDGTALAGLSCTGFGDFIGGNLRCGVGNTSAPPSPAGCWLDFSDCRLPVCGNGVIEPGEDCDGAALGAATCDALGFLGGALGCAACRYTTATCNSPGMVTFLPTTFDTAQSTSSDGSLELVAFDALGFTGSLDGAMTRESEHKLRMYLSRVGAIDWLLVFAADAGEYRGTAGMLLEIARFNLRFAGPTMPSALAEINGIAVDAEGRPTGGGERPQIVLGSDANDFVSFGNVVNGAHGQVADTGLFTANADMTTVGPPLVLELLLGGIHLDRWKRENGTDSNVSRFHWGPSGTRVFAAAHCDPGDLSGTCAEQRGLCNEPNRCRVSWNATTERFEATHQTTDWLASLPVAAQTGAVRTVSDWGIAVQQMANLIKVDDPALPRVCAYSDVPSTQGCVFDGDCTTVPSGLCVMQKVPFSLLPPSAAPMELEPGGCDEPTKPVEFFPKSTAAELVAELGVPDKVMITMDRSASMLEPVSGLTDRKRIEFARSAAMNLVLQSDGKANQLGLASFAGQLPVWPAQPNAGEGTYTSGVDLPMLPVGPEVMKRTKEAWQASVDAIVPVVPGEGTAICAGLQTARDALVASPGGSRGILLLTDGANNRPFGTCNVPPVMPLPTQTGADAFDCLYDTECDGTYGSCTSLCKPADVVAAMAVADNVRVVLVPTGGQEASSQAVQMATASNGMVIEAPDADALPSAYFEANAHFRGESPSLTRRPSVATDLEVGDVHPVYVEEGAERFNVQVSMRGAPADVPTAAAAWTPRVLLLNPAGSVVLDSFQVTPPAGFRVLFDPNFVLMQVDNPAMGIWRIYIVRSSPSVPEVRSFVTAHIEHTGPDCSVKATPAVSDGRQPVTITAQAVFGEPVFTGATFSGEVRVPGGASVPLTFTRDANGMGVAQFDPTSFTSVGMYQIVVGCQVVDSATFPPGEAIFGNPPPPASGIPAFTREARGFFYSFGGPLQGLPAGQDGPGDDPDHDGITNANEPPGDTDHDGLIDALDPNADGDGTPDSYDPDPTDHTVEAPTFPPGPGCVPSITATQGQVILRCGDTPAPTPVAASASCGGTPVALTGTVISINGVSVTSASFSGTNPILPEGEVVIRWTAKGPAGRATRDQTVVVSGADSPAACCPAGSTLVEGTLFSDALIRLDNKSYCIFGYDGFDLLLGGPGADVLSGGAFSDEVVGGAAGDVLYGGSSADQLTLSLGGTAFGGAGPDSLFAVLGSSTLYGGDGPDAILGSPANDEIIPGPGPDAVEASAGNDIVRIYDLCEILPGEALDGGPGIDTLYTPVPVADLLARNVVLTNFEVFVVTGSSESYKSECACTVETCGDFLDNDCDGTTDEGAAAEICADYVDNTCDGLVDEGCPGGPCASEVSTVDAHVAAGRAVASSCPGSSTDLVFDNFSSALGKWTETGEGDWNTETLHSSLGYPASGASGSPAAHSDGCSTSCTLTLTTGLDLRGSTTATLEFLRFVDVELDATDYLRIELYNGTSWTTAFSWTGGAGDDDRWHAESYNLSAYLGVSNFKVRMVMKADSIIEHVHIDDLRVKRTLSSACFTAVGSGENLGSNGASTVTLYEASPGVWSTTCNTGACVPTPDACDGIDNDCDSKIDETCAGCLACNPSDFCGTDLPDFCGNQIDCGCGAGQVCTSNAPGTPGDCCAPLQCLPGFCGYDVLDGCGGVQDCRSNCGAGTYCPALLPGTVVLCAFCGPEICFDGLDNDCDDGADDGCGICVDYASTVDRHVSKGRAVGASCTPTTLFSDAFASLTQWTESGEGDWNTETLHETTNYPATGSNSPALHADGCTTSCTMTQATTIDLRGRASPRLEFLRFADSTLDSTDYLRVEVFNGLLWVTAFSWSGGVGDDNVWHAESLDLTPYANASNFRVRFVTKVNLTDEHVHIDDVRITTTTGQTCADYRALGSNDSLGGDLAATVALAELPAGYFKKGSCP